jgi:hypothetical protein
MVTRSDWLPRPKTAKIEMSNNWAAKIAANPGWEIPAAVPQNLTAKTAALQTLLLTPPEDRTPTINARIKAAEKALDDAMRDVKKRYFYVPPLDDADLISLGLKPKDAEPTEIPAPEARVQATFQHEGNAMVLRITTPVSPDLRPYHGVKMRYAILDQAAPPPANPEQLTTDDFITAKKKKYTFDAEYSGKYLYYRLRWESKTGKKGPWGDIQKTIIV